MFPCDCDDFHTFLIAGCSFGNLSFYFFIEEQSSLQAALLYIGSFPFGVTMFICTLVVYICITGTFILSLKNRAVYKPLFFIQRVCYSGYNVPLHIGCVYLHTINYCPPCIGGCLRSIKPLELHDTLFLQESFLYYLVKEKQTSL